MDCDSQDNEVQLLNIYQETHVERICEILINRNIPLFFDTTGMGGGKSYTTLRVFQRLQDFYINVEWTLLVICPKPAMNIWQNLTQIYKIPAMIHNYSYISGRYTSKKNNFSIRHSYLTCEFDENSSNRLIYSYTDELLDLNRGNKRLLLVFDEAQSLKNLKTHINKAVTVFINGVLAAADNTTCMSRIAFLSATLLDKQEHYESFMRVSNICNKPINTIEGMNQVIRFSYNLDPSITLQIRDRYQEPLKKKFRKRLCITLFIKVILGNISSGMPVSIPSRKYRGFFDITHQEDIDGIKEANKLIDLAIDIEDGKLIKGGIGNVSLGLHKINVHAVFDMCRIAKDYLDDEENCKVILSFDYKSNVLNRAEELMSEYGVNLLFGEVPDNERLISINNFNAPNNNVRVLIMTSRTGGESISLHDTDPECERTRYMFVTPGYRCSLIQQITGRIFREGQTSIGRAIVFHPKNVEIPLNIFDTLKEKSIVTGTTYSQHQNIMLPGTYPIFIENRGYCKYNIPTIYENINRINILSRYLLDAEPEPYYELKTSRL